MINSECIRFVKLICRQSISSVVPPVFHGVHLLIFYVFPLSISIYYRTPTTGFCTANFVFHSHNLSRRCSSVAPAIPRGACRSMRFLGGRVHCAFLDLLLTWYNLLDPPTIWYMLDYSCQTCNLGKMFLSLLLIAIASSPRIAISLVSNAVRTYYLLCVYLVIRIPIDFHT